MKKKFRFLFLVVAIFGLMAIGQSGNAEDPLCLKFTTLWLDDYQINEGARCMCSGVYNGGNIVDCERSLFAGDCHKRECNSYACCHPELNPN